MKQVEIYVDKKWYNRTPDAELTTKNNLAILIGAPFIEKDYTLTTVLRGCCVPEYHVILSYTLKKTK